MSRFWVDGIFLPLMVFLIFPLTRYSVFAVYVCLLFGVHYQELECIFISDGKFWNLWLGWTSREQLMSPECLKDQVLSFAETLVVNQQKKISLLSSVFSRVLDEYIQSIHIHRHVFRSSQDSSVWLMLTSREQPMSPECSKYQVLSFA